MKKIRVEKQIEVHVAAAEKLAKKNGGVLPFPNMIRTSGHTALAAAMRRNPAAFKHIPQYSGYKSVEEHIADAKSLIRQHRVFPTKRWLKKNGYRALVHQIERHPEKFSSIRRRRRGTIEEFAALP